MKRMVSILVAFRREIVSVLVAVYLIALLLTGCSNGLEPIQVWTVTAKPVADLVDFTWYGNIEALHSVDVAPNTSGKVLSIPVIEGQNVNTGDTLFSLDSADQELQLKQAEAAYQAARVAAANAAAAYNENTLVLPAQLARDEAQENYQRLQILYEAAAISEVELNNALLRLETAESQLKAAQINQKSNYENSQAQLSTAQVAVEIAAKRLSDCTVTAPSDGMIAKINTEIGAFVSQQSPAITLIDNSGMQVKIQVMETDIGQITAGMSMDIYVPVTNDIYEGSVGGIESLGNTKTGMFEVSVLLKNTANLPRLGLTAEVRLTGGEPANTVSIPAAGIISENGQSWAFIVKDAVISKRQVTLITENNAYWEVEGLNAGDEVVINSSEALTDGAKVRVVNWLNSL